MSNHRRPPTGDVGVPWRSVAAEVAGSRAASDSVTVLVVDDDPGVLEVLQLALDAEGYHVVVARNGREALEQAARSRPRLVLVDLMMPVMDGWEFVREFRRSLRQERTPIIILSALRHVQEATRGLDVQAVLAKPFNLDELLDVVAAHVASAPS